MGIHARIKKRVSKTFLLDIEFETTGAACLGILGSSGSGKSMTLKCIAGIETPDEGVITVDGTTLFDSEKKINLRPQQRSVGYLFQHYALFPTMTVARNISAPLAGGNREKKEYVERLLKRFDLCGLENRLPFELSGGQQQRVALARMLAASPRAVLLDEPFSALDINLREHMQREFLGLLKPGKEDSFRNALLVTHSRDEAFTLCPHLLVMHDGRAVIQGETHSVFKNPRCLKAAEITGCKNISRARRTGSRSLDALDWGVELQTAADLPHDLSHVGIRAHCIANGDSSSASCNKIEVRILETMHSPFETTLVCVNARHPASHEIRWQYPGGEHEVRVRSLFLPPEHLLPLCSGDIPRPDRPDA